MGLDVDNGLFGNFHLNWAGTSWFRQWCAEHRLPEPFIGWRGFNDGDPCRLGKRRKHTALAAKWCEALDERCPELAKLGQRLLTDRPEDLHEYLYPHRREDDKLLEQEEWERRAVAAWYAILRHGIAKGDILYYW